MKNKKNQYLSRWKLLAKIGGILACCLVVIVLSVLIRGNETCSNVTQTFKQITTPQNDLSVFTNDIKNYKRAEDSTYLTFPEWYIVYSAQEYAKVIKLSRPSKFPYLAAVGQYWCAYKNVHTITKETYPFNSGNHLMLVVIGVSFSGEYIFKGLYETTLGRVNELLSFYQKTPEDVYSENVAREYGQFLTQTPWYEFPFKEKLFGLWTNTPLIGPYPLRKLERKIILSAEYGIKGLYAVLIRKATQTVFDPADLTITAHMDTPSAATLTRFPNIKISKKITPTSSLVQLPRYQEFNNTVPTLTLQSLNIYSLGGNDEILITVLSPSTWTMYPLHTTYLFHMDALSFPGYKRVALQVPVTKLSDTLQSITKQGVTLEHIYDY